MTSNQNTTRYPPPPSPPSLKTSPQNSYNPSTAPLPPGHPNLGVMHETDEELTEDERIAYENGLITWKKAASWRFWFRREWLWYYVLLLVLVLIAALLAFFHKDIVNWLTPFVRKLQSIKYGWLIPVAIIFALSFPPLFGNGLVWGLGVGFAIAVVGTVLGEIANFLVFRYMCRTRAEKMARKSLNWACLCQAIAEGGFPMALLVRLSAVPTHFTTVVFAVCGLAFWKFLIALILGTPKQLIAVYVGVVLGEDQNGTSSTNSHVISDAVFGVTAVVTLASLFIIYRKMLKVRKKVLISMRNDLQSKHVNVTAMPNNFDNGNGINGGAVPANGYVPTASPEQAYGGSYGSSYAAPGQQPAYASGGGGYQDPAYGANQYKANTGYYSNAAFQPSENPREQVGYLNSPQAGAHAHRM